MHETLRIPEERLRSCLQDQFELSRVTLEFLPLGHDYDATVYRVVSEQGRPYLLKVTSRPLYESRYLVPRYLNDQGITAVVAPLPTRSGVLWTTLADWTVILYPWISGETTWTGMTDGQWMETGAIFKRIHQVTLPPAGFASLRKETFDPAEYTRWVRAFETQHLHSESRGASERALRSSWVAHQSTIHTVVTSLEKLAGVLQPGTFPYVICHADLHANNLIRDRAGQVFVIDWDEVMLAPKERDFIFVRPPHAGAFFQGYGQTQVDWMVLTYYLWERVIQDLIEYAQSVCFREDWGEEARAEAAHMFHENLTKAGGTIDAAYAASAHLSENLTIDIRKSS